METIRLRTLMLFPALLLAVRPPPAPADDAARSAPAELRTDSRIRELRTLESRLLLDAGRFRLLFTDIRTDDSAYTAAGVGWPRFVAGPVRREGLLQRLYRPLRSRVFSAVWEEAPGLSLETGFSRAPAGAYLRVTPEALSLFGLLSDEAPAGGFLFSLGERESRFRDRSAVVLDLGVLHAVPTVEPPDEAAADSWFREEPPFPGGSLSTGAVALDAGAGRFFVTVVGALARGDFVPPSWFAEARAVADLGVLETGVIGGRADPYFRSPDGEPAARLARGGGELRLFPDSPISLGGGVYRTFLRGDALDGHIGDRILDAHGSLAVRRGRLRAAVTGRHRLTEDRKGEPEREGSAAVDLAVRDDRAHAEIRLALLTEEGGYAGWNASVGGGRTEPRFSADVDTNLRVCTERVRLSVSCTLRRRGGRKGGPDLFLRIETGKPLDIADRRESEDDEDEGASGILTISAGIGTRTTLRAGSS